MAINESFFIFRSARFCFFAYILNVYADFGEKKRGSMILPVNGKFEMPALPYAKVDLVPVLTAETIEFHYGKHLQTYVNNLNAALPGTAFEGKLLEEIVKTSEGGVFNNAGQILNHALYFLQFAAPKEGNAPTGKIADSRFRFF